ncbi:MAG: acetyl-CoA carboxylase biotin carboxyl carrier protein [Gammaproteobacteria bacterium]|nr:acetyl-CoA carboxylase biotin carboxyl carrier protein [Gammaproteobacteria bacterium]
MDIRKIRKLIELINETGVAEIEVHEDKESVRISRYSHAPAQVTPVHYAQQPESHPSHANTQSPQAASAPKESTPIKGYTVKSPMVGTVYLAPTPGEKPFVEVGQRVEVGDVLCLIEAMKMYNQIESDKAGVISARLIDNESPVEFDQPLFIIE